MRTLTKINNTIYMTNSSYSYYKTVKVLKQKPDKEGGETGKRPRVF
jgi:hypothetical protein